MADTPNTPNHAGDGASTVSDLADLKVLTGGEAAPAVAADAAAGDTGVSEAAPPPPPPPSTPAILREKEVDAQGRAYATGRRKDAVARVWLKPGSGKITVNGRDQTIYFARPTQRMMIQQPFDVSQRNGQFDVIATVTGGGLSGQAGAVRHGISQALAKYEPDLRSAMKQSGFLTRDSRVVERKKYGKMKARRSFQFSKR